MNVPQTATEDDGLSPALDLVSAKLLMIGNLLRRSAAQRYQRLLGLSSVEVGLLGMMGRRRSMTLNRLSESVGIDKGQASRALTKLEQKALVTRRPNPSDTREVHLALTPEGLRMHDALVSHGRERNDLLLADISPEDRALFNDILERLRQRAVDMLQTDQSAL